MSNKPSFPPPLPVRHALRQFSNDCKTWRKLAGLTQAQLADRAGVDRKSVLRLEQGNGAVSFEIVLRVLHSLGALELVTRAIDPYETDVGRMRADDRLPQRVRPRHQDRGDG